MVSLPSADALTVIDVVPVLDVDAHEGPVYAADEDALYFTTLPRRDASGVPHVAIRRLQLDGIRFPLERSRLTSLREDTNVANGMFLNRAGGLYVCEQGTLSAHARISLVDRTTGAVTTVVDGLGELGLNSPNDVVVKSDGTVWFTDPSYGYLQGFRPAPQLPDAVYRYQPATGLLSVAAQIFDKPNGLAFSPDEQVLYVADNGRPHHLLGFDVLADGRLGRGRLIAASAAGHPDGLKVDIEGRIYASAPGGVVVLAPDGQRLAEISVPGAVNFTFGGRERNVLFITADTAIWAAVLNTKGAISWQ